MTHLGQVVARLIDDLSIISPLPSQICVNFTWPSHVEPVAWFNAQSLFPQFYWQTRDSNEEVIALGQCASFTDPTEAENALLEGQRIWGGCAFEPHTQRGEDEVPSSYFFLPQIELIRKGSEWSCVVNVGKGRADILTALSALCFFVRPLYKPEWRVLSMAHEPPYSHWEKRLEKALEAIKHTELQKVVLARKTTLVLNGLVSAVQLLHASIHENQGNFHFLLAMDEKRSFVGSSPERLFFRRQLGMKTEALAGTVGRGGTLNEDVSLANWLLNDEKNRYENKLVVDDILDRLLSSCREIHIEKEPHLVRLRQVQHLKRNMTVSLKRGISNASLLNVLHPTAAVAGRPRKAALAFIAKEEGFDRGWYSGTVGYLSPERTEFCVAIRSAVLSEKNIALYAGAGIVPGSQPENEWKELDRKISTLMSLLNSGDEKVACTLKRREKMAG